MKKGIILKKFLLLTLLCTLSFSQGVENIGNFEEAKAVSKQSGKPIFYFHSASSCHYCDKSMNHIYRSNNLKDMINRDFVFIKAERDQVLVPYHLDDSLTPVFYILDENGEKVSTQRGYLDRIALIKFLNVGKYKHSRSKK